MSFIYADSQRVENLEVETKVVLGVEWVGQSGGEAGDILVKYIAVLE